MKINEVTLVLKEQNVQPRPTGSGRNVRGSQMAWDRRFGATHNPDGTPKPGAAPAPSAATQAARDSEAAGTLDPEQNVFLAPELQRAPQAQTTAPAAPRAPAVDRAPATPRAPQAPTTAPAAPRAPQAPTTAPAAPRASAPNAATQAARDSEAAGTLDPEQNVFLAPELEQPPRAPAPRGAAQAATPPDELMRARPEADPAADVAADDAARQAPAAAPAADNFTLTQTLRRGSRGDEVRQLQAALGFPEDQQDGIFGPQTERAVRNLQQNMGIQVDGIVGRQTLAAIQRSRENPNAPRDVQPGRIENSSIAYTNNALVEGIVKLAGLEKKNLNEASININGADASEVAEILRMMQLAGAPGAKVVGIDDINPGPKPCPMCGKIHGPMPTPGGCGMPEPEGPPEPSMGDMIRMVSKEEEEVDGDFQDATTEPDETYMNDVSASVPSGNDLHKEKGSYPATAGGDNPMRIKEALWKALAEKKAKPDFLDMDKDGDKKEPMKKAIQDKKKKKKD